MGSRGASSGIADNGKPYGTEYSTIFQQGNIKFITINEGSTAAPLETMTKGRVYVTINKKLNKPQYITYYDKRNKRYNQIDIEGKPHLIEGEWVLPHVQGGYEHEKPAKRLSKNQQKMVDRVKKTWENRGKIS